MSSGTDTPSMPDRGEGGGRGDGDGDELLLAQASAEHRRGGVADERADRVAGRGEAVHVRRLAVTAQREGDGEDEEADRRPDGDHADRTDDHHRAGGSRRTRARPPGAAAARARGRTWSTTTAAARYSSAPTRSVHSGPVALISPTAATAPTAAVMLAKRASRAFALDQRVGIVDEPLHQGLLHDARRLADDRAGSARSDRRRAAAACRRGRDSTAPRVK